MIPSLQELFEMQGFIVLAYTDPVELAADDKRGTTNGEIEGAMEGIPAALIGEATKEEWLRQCDTCHDPYWSFDGRDYVGFRKVAVE